MKPDASTGLPLGRILSMKLRQIPVAGAAAEAEFTFTLPESINIYIENNVRWYWRWCRVFCLINSSTETVITGFIGCSGENLVFPRHFQKVHQQTKHKGFFSQSKQLCHWKSLFISVNMVFSRYSGFPKTWIIMKKTAGLTVAAFPLQTRTKLCQVFAFVGKTQFCNCGVLNKKLN